MDKIKLSWSILNAWTRGDKDAAIGMIYGKKIPETPAMANGSRVHELISTQRLRLLPCIDDTYVFEDIEPDAHRWVNYFKINIYPWLDLSMRIDVLSRERGVVIDWKTGKHSSADADPMQIYLYAIALEKIGVPINTGIMAKVNDDVTLSDYTVIKIGPHARKQGYEFIDTYAAEIFAELNRPQ